MTRTSFALLLSPCRLDDTGSVAEFRIVATWEDVGAWRPMTDAPGAGPSRRSVLAGSGLLLIAACTGSPTAVVPRLTPDQRLARRVADQITVLAAAYAATIAAHPTTRTALGPLAAEHAAHVAALVALLPAPSGSPSPSGSSSPSGSTSPSASPPPVAASPADAVAALAAAERTAAARRRGQAGRAGAELARLLASIAACEAVHIAQVAHLHANLVKA
jgi:hypothetical protein